MAHNKTCINCNRLLINQNGAWLCRECNSNEIDVADIFVNESVEDDGYVTIECHGASEYEPGTNNVIAGVDFKNNTDPFEEPDIVEHPVYAPTHKHRRRIKQDALGKIRRCQGCQDYTVRMRRREGPDMYIPSSNHPGRTKLKSVEALTYEP